MPQARHTKSRQRDHSGHRSTRAASVGTNQQAQATVRPISNIVAPVPPPHGLATNADLRTLKRLIAFHKYDYALQRFDWDTQTRTAWLRLPSDAHPALSAVHLRAHLEQRISIAAYAAKRPCVINGEDRRRAVTRHILIDLDFRGSDEDLRTRADGVRRALGEPTFVQLSPGGGAHMVYLFAHDVPLLNLRGPGGKAGSVMRLLREHGLTECRGSVEVYPADKSWQAAENGCRLPFGPGSYLLDPKTLCIMERGLCGLQALRQISARLSSGELEYVDANVWHARAAKLPRVPREDSGVVANAHEKAKPFLDHGLRKFGERRRGLVALAHHFWWQGTPESQAVEATQDWLRTRHNDCSRTWNEAVDKQPLLDECEEIVSATYRMQQLRLAKSTKDFPFLTTAEVRPLLMLALDVASSQQAGRPVTFAARTKRVRIDPLKLVDLGVHMLRCFAARLECIAMEAYVKGGGDFSEAYRRVLSRCRPNFAAQRFRLPLPRAAMLLRVTRDDGAMLRGKRAVGKDRIAAYLGFLLKRAPEVFLMASDFCAQQYKSRDYWVPVDLYGDRVVSTGADAWVRSGLVDSIRPLISPYLWKNKLQPAAQTLMREVPHVRPLAFAMRGVRLRIDAAAQARRVQQHIDAGGSFIPVAAEWEPGSPEQELLRLPEPLRHCVEDLRVKVNEMDAMEVASFVRLDHVEDLRRDTLESLTEAFLSCFPNATLLVTSSRRANTGLRIKVRVASDAGVCALENGMDAGDAAGFGGDHDSSVSLRRLKRAIAKAARAAFRDAIYRRNLHMHSDFRDFEAPADFSRDFAGATPPPR